MRTSRRVFLGAAVGLALHDRLGFAETLMRTARERLRFGALDPLVDLMQETAADELLPKLAAALRSGTPLADLVAAGALANARAHGGTNYNGYHALMALVPSYEMSTQLSGPYAALPVLKVLHRNARFIQDVGRGHTDALEPLAAADGDTALVESIRARDLPQAERSLARLEAGSRARAYEELQTAVRDDMNVHRVVLAWRAYDLLRLAGEQNAVSLLRQAVRFCIDEDGRAAKQGRAPNEMRALLPELMEKHALGKRERGTRAADAAWIEQLARTVFGSPHKAAAQAVAEALAAGFDPEDVGRALSLAATQLLLHDAGSTSEAPGKPVGTVHGATTGLHASDAANAWRQLARSGGASNAFASLIAGAYHTAGQSDRVGAQAWDHDGEPCTKEDPLALRAEIEARIRARDQKGACQAARRYVALGHPPEPLFALLLEFAVSEDGALHAEKYFRTAQEEHADARAEHRGLYLVALTRVTASEFGFPDPGCAVARKLLAG